MKIMGNCNKDVSNMTIRVAGAQIPVTDNIGDNFKQIKSAIEEAGAKDVDILLTPEGSLSGYTHKFDQNKVEFYLKKIEKLAVSYNLGLALGTCFYVDDSHCYNQLRFYDQQEFLGFHSKILTCGTLTEPSHGEIEHYAVKPLETFTLKDITIGGLICNDMWANPACTPQPDPHLSQQLSDMGAHIIFHAVNGGRDQSEFSRVTTTNYHESNLRIRARAGKVWIVTVDNCFPVNIHRSSPGGVIDPQGNWRVKSPIKGKDLFVYDID